MQLLDFFFKLFTYRERDRETLPWPHVPVRDEWHNTMRNIPNRKQTKQQMSNVELKKQISCWWRKTPETTFHDIYNNPQKAEV